MSAGKELHETATWLGATLKAGTALTTLLGGTAIYEDLAPNGVATPYVVYSHYDSGDAVAAYGGRAASWSQFTVKAVTRGPAYGSAAAIMGAVDALLHRKAGTVNSGSVPALYVLECVRGHEVRYAETEQGVRFVHYGAVYDIWAENA